MISKIIETRIGREVQIDGYEDKPEIFQELQEDNLCPCPEDKEKCRDGSRCEVNVVFAMSGREATRRLCELVFHNQPTK